MSSPSSIPSTSSASESPASFGSDESSIIDMSFDYDYDDNGNFVRVSKGSSKSSQSAPSTPPLHANAIASMTSSAPAVSTVEANKASHRRSSLSRSESMPSDSLNVPPSRPLQRAISGPIHVASATPVQPTRTVAPLSTGLQGTARKLTGGPQRVRREDAERQRREIEERNRRELEEAERERVRRAIEEKENALLERHSPPYNHARSIVSLPSRQYNFPRSIRPLLSIKSSTITKINEVETSESESDNQGYKNNGIALNVQNNQQYSYNVSASQSKNSPTENIDQHDPAYLPASRLQPQNIPIPSSRPSSNLSTVSKVRRVTLEEKLRQEREIGAEEAQGILQRERMERDENPSPTHVGSNRVHQGQTRGTHQRRDSDTLRIASAVQAAKREREWEEGRQLEQQYYQDQYLEQDQARAHQQYQQNPSPTGRTGGTATLVNSQAGQPLRHKRSPTAPEAPTTSSDLAQTNGNPREAMKTWANGDKAADRRDDGAEQPIKVVQDVAQRVTLQQPQAQPMEGKSSRYFFVNKKQYARLDMIGKGGSSRVFRVITPSNEIFALKKVSLDKSDVDTVNGYMNEIQLLKRLEGNQRIIRLVDSEVKVSSVANRGNLLMVMECGEIDLAKLLQEQQKEPMNMVWIAYYWQQMLQAVHVIHEEKIVHSDLKPANFVLVKGQLKLIDFGIANAIASDTTNIQRDHQIGTVNYMSPEAIAVPEGMRRLKVGRPSDVWSLGCILYQMVYGHPPFYNLDMVQKMKNIPDDSYIINYPENAVPTRPSTQKSNSTPSPPQKLLHLSRVVRKDVIATMRRCLNRNPKDRATIPDLLGDAWLEMNEGDSFRKREHEKAEPRELQLAEDESIINPYFMKQLLQHAIRCAKHRTVDLTDEEQDDEARKLVQELRSMYAPVPSRR